MVLFVLKHFDHLITQRSHLEKLGIITLMHLDTFLCWCNWQGVVSGMTTHEFHSLESCRIKHLHESSLLLYTRYLMHKLPA